MTQIRVCYLANQALKYAFEGHNVASTRIIQAAIRAGIDAEVVSLEKARTTSSQGFYPVKIKESQWKLGEIWSSLPAMLQAKALDCDILHLLNVTKEIFSLTRIFLRMNSPCLAHLYHSHFPFNSYANFKLRLLFIRLGIFDHLLCSNRLLIHYLTNQSALSLSSMYYVPYPVDVERFKPMNREKLREIYGLPLDAPIIAYIGAIDPHRGLFILLDAFKKVLKEIPDALMYISIPRLDRDEQPYAPHFYRLVRCQELRDHIIVKGPTPNVEEVYCLANLVALPFIEPYWICDPPLVILEAMACATPIVTSAVGEIKEIGRDRWSMIFSNPGDSDSLAQTIIYYLKNQDEAKKIGLNARKIAEKTFSMEAVGKKLNSIYRGIAF